ncbi:MAG TPA: ROK family protein [Solirubrobacterales bacterium]|jgi:fructokinase|nr:ROK family protein [Solirubrobacterales bacterium]
MSVGGIEAGGTHWNCAVGCGDGVELARTESFPTTTPAETIGRAVEFFAAGDDLEALGLGLFGPVEVRRDSPRWGTITTTPKPGWADTDVAAALAGALDVPIALDTDVNAAAVGEWRHGAARGLETFVYVTVGTGIGGGVFANGRPVHGLMHPEVGHMLVPHDRSRDPFAGCCPFHGDCLEGLASGTAMRERWGRPAEELTDAAAWELEAEYLALGLANVVLTLSAERIVLGGGVGSAPGLVDRVRSRLPEILAGYVSPPPVVPPGLGARSGVIGALTLARTSC